MKKKKKVSGARSRTNGRRLTEHVPVRRNHKDRLFIRLFREKSALLELYNALNGTDYADPSALEITTLEDAVYLGMKNDCSFLISSWLNLYEQQSTFCPNMPVRNLMYLARLYQGYIAEHALNLYGSAKITLPAPRCVVFYNGTQERPEREELLLSGLFAESGGCAELKTLVLNINEGQNPSLMAQSRTLCGYSALIGKVREFQNAGMQADNAVDAACVYCIEHNYLREFLEKNRNEVRRLLLTEYDAKKQRALDRRDAKAEGRAVGKAEDILDLLQDSGPMPAWLTQRILAETNLALLRNWLRTAAKAASAEDFIREANLTPPSPAE